MKNSRVERKPITYKKDLGLSRLGVEHPTFRLRGERSKPLRNRCSEEKVFLLNVCVAEVADHFQI